MAPLIDRRDVPLGIIRMQQTISPEQAILFLLITAMGLIALILSFAYMIYGEEE